LAGKCIKPQKHAIGGFGSARDEDVGLCGGRILLTVSEGAVRKYIAVTNHVMDEFGVSQYTRDKVKWFEGSVDSLFKNDRVKQFTLDDFI
jgi:DNA polymerase II large subunit